jgi:hypothetical protein
MELHVKLSKRREARKSMRNLAVSALLIAVAALLTWPVRAQTATPTPTPASGPDGASVTLYLPPDPPTVSIDVECLSPGDDGWCRMPVAVRIFGHAAGSPIARLDYVRDGQLSSASGEFVTFEDGINGAHTVIATAIDLLGRQSASASQSFKVDRSLPVAQFDGYGDNALNIAISDEGAGVTRWTVQVFDGNGGSVFYQEGSGPLAGKLSWVAAPDIYQVEMFARDAAGNEAHFPRTAFVISPPSPVSVFEQVLGFFAPTATATPKPRTATPKPASATLTPSVPTATLFPPTSTAIATASPKPAVSAPTPRVESGAPDRPARNIIRLLSLAALLGLLVIWAASAGLDRRASAISALADELKSLLEARTRGVIRP